MLTFLTMETWGSDSALRAPHQVLISWELSPSRFFKVNFDGSVRGRDGGAGFIIHGSGFGIIAAGVTIS